MSLDCRQQTGLLLCRYSIGDGWAYPARLPQLPDGSVDWGMVNVVTSLPNRFIGQPMLPGLGLTPWYLHARRMLLSDNLTASTTSHDGMNHTGNYTAYLDAIAAAEHRSHHSVNSSAYIPVNVTTHSANHTARLNASHLHDAFPADGSALRSSNSSLSG